MKTSKNDKKLHKTIKIAEISQSTEKESKEEECLNELDNHVKRSINACRTEFTESKIFEVEKAIIKQTYEFGRLLIQLYLLSSHIKFDYSQHLRSGTYYLKKTLRYRTIKTVFGKVIYGRCYLKNKNSAGGYYPFDIKSGITQDGFSPLVIKFVTNLATRMSFKSSCELFKRFFQWTPSTEAVQRLVLGVGKYGAGFMKELTSSYEGDGEKLVIEIDGKATSTATEEELRKRRGKRKAKEARRGCKCGCQRHRGKSKQKGSKSGDRRKRGSKSKNGRSITLVAMYTLKQDKEGLLHGQVNKKIWGSYCARIEMIKWARDEAQKRGFDPATSKNIHIVLDGEKVLKDGMSEYFKEATFALDIRHLEEKIWKTGRAFHAEGSKVLREWVDGYVEKLYQGEAGELVQELKELLKSLSTRAENTKNKRKRLQELIKYMEPRISMLQYKELMNQDLVIASGVIEGAARYVVGERMDCSGMRWIPQKAEALLHLRCIELNGDWDNFFDWVYQKWTDGLNNGDAVQVRTNAGIDLGEKYAKAA